MSRTQFDNLSPEVQDRYIKSYPNSAVAKYKKGRAVAKEVSGLIRVVNRKDSTIEDRKSALRKLRTRIPKQVNFNGELDADLAKLRLTYYSAKVSQMNQMTLIREARSNIKSEALALKAEQTRIINSGNFDKSAVRDISATLKSLQGRGSAKHPLVSAKDKLEAKLGRLTNAVYKAEVALDKASLY